MEKGSEADTDTQGDYRLWGEVYQHRSVRHSEEYVSEEGAHCNTAESEWSIFKPWWRRFRGIAKRYLHLYLSHHSFRRTYRDRSRIERTQAMIGFLIIGIWEQVREQMASLGEGLDEKVIITASLLLSKLDNQLDILSF